MEYYIIIPAHNEAAFLEDALTAVAAQTLLPGKVVIVNDASTDATEAIIDAFVSDYSFFYKVTTAAAPEHLPGSKVIRAFEKGLAVLDTHFNFIVKLDADIVLPPAYFESIAGIFKKHPGVGIAGGFAYEKDENGVWVLNHPMHTDHVRGGFKAYTRACFRAIGGLRPSIGWDTVDELLARYHGFGIYTDAALKVKHLRPTGSSYHKKARRMQGEAMYKMRYGFVLTAIASAKMAWKQGNSRVFFDNMKGYSEAKKRKIRPLVSKEEGAFIRRYRYRKMFRRLF